MQRYRARGRVALSPVKVQEDTVMKRCSVLVWSSCIMLMAGACTQRATQEECEEACNRLSTLHKEARAQQNTQAVDEELGQVQKKLEELADQQTEALETLNQELEDKLANADSEQEKTSLQNEYAQKKEAKSKEFEAQIKVLTEQKDRMQKAAEEAKAAEQEESAAREQKELHECVTVCVETNTKKTIARCRAAAKDLETYKNCKQL